MTTHISEDTAMQALQAARPEPELIDQTWNEERAESVLQRVDLTAPALAKTGRRWAAVAAVAALLAGVGLAAQTIVPAGVPGTPVKANALELLAQVAQSTPIPAGSYAQDTTSFVQVQAGVTIKASTTRWVASDGWVWSVSDGSELPQKVYQKAPDLLDPHNAAASLLPAKLPSDPQVLKRVMVERYDELMTHSNRSPAEVRDHRPPSLLAAIYEGLVDPRTASQDRAALFRTLALVEGLAITTDTIDPQGRPALAAKVTYRRSWDNSEQRSTVYFDPTNGDPLAWEERSADGTTRQVRVITDRRIVPALPEHVAKILGTKRVKKTVTR